MAVSTRRVIGRIVTTIVVLVIAGAAVLGYQNRQEIADHFAAQRFTPTQEILDLTDRIDPSVSGRRIFFASEPTLDASQSFNSQCAEVDHSEEGHVLGCFVRGRIHLFKVTDERLNGIVEVTAAHELLHASFSRLDDAARTDLTTRLMDVYAELSAQDPELAARMEVYRGLSDSAFANELHSVLATEVRELPDWLEEHYAQWFLDRTLIVDFFDSYHAVFIELRERASVLESELQVLRPQIEERSAAYDAAVQAFNREWAVFLQQNEDYEFSGRAAEFYSIRSEFETRRNNLNAELDSLNADIARYETMRVELQQLAELNTELQSHLNSELAPPAETPTA